MKYLASLLILSGCVSQQIPELTEKPQAAVERLLSEERYDEARQLRATSGLQAQIEQTIRANEACVPTLRRCSTQGLAIYEAKECRSEIQRKCDNDYFMSKNFKDMKTTVSDKLYDSIQAMESAQKSICEDGMRWGYAIHKTRKDCVYCAVSLRENLKSLTGEFEKRDMCEEERTRTDEKSKFTLSASCHKRYLGSPKTQRLWKAKAIVRRQASTDGAVDSLTVYFGSETKCSAALTMGMEHVATEYMPRVRIFGKGSAELSRFVTDCSEESFELCEKYKSEPGYIPEIVF